MRKIKILSLLFMSLFFIGCGGNQTFSHEKYEFFYPADWVVKEVAGGKILIPKNTDDYKSPDFRIDIYQDNLTDFGGAENFKKYFSEFKQNTADTEVKVLDQQRDGTVFKMISENYETKNIVYEIWFLPGEQLPAHIILMTYSPDDNAAEQLKTVADMFYESFKLKK